MYVIKREIHYKTLSTPNLAQKLCKSRVLRHIGPRFHSSHSWRVSQSLEQSLREPYRDSLRFQWAGCSVLRSWSWLWLRLWSTLVSLVGRLVGRPKLHHSFKNEFCVWMPTWWSELWLGSHGRGRNFHTWVALLYARLHIIFQRLRFFLSRRWNSFLW